MFVWELPRTDQTRTRAVVFPSCDAHRPDVPDWGQDETLDNIYDECGFEAEVGWTGWEEITPKDCMAWIVAKNEWLQAGIPDAEMDWEAITIGSQDGQVVLTTLLL